MGFKDLLRKQQESDNKYEGSSILLKSIFHHSKKEIAEKVDIIHTERYLQQEELLCEEFQNLKVSPRALQQQQ